MGEKRDGYVRDGLQARLQRAQREQEKCAGVVNRVQSCVGELQELVARNFQLLQKQLRDLSVRICHHTGTLLVERVLKALEDQTQDAGEVAGLYVKSWKIRLGRIVQLVRDPTRVRDVQAENPGTGSRGGDKSNSAPTNPGGDGNDADAGPSSA